MTSWSRGPTIHKVNGTALKEIDQVVRSLRELADRHNAKPYVAIENQFGGSRTGFKSIETLLRRRHEWEILCEIYGVEVVRVYPATWQGALLNRVPKFNSDGTKKTTKARSLLLATKLWPKVEGWTQDTAEAAAIAEWFRTRLMREGMLF